jgi:radical SAM protein with 4Fe4S-binding SPASM domain
MTRPKVNQQRIQDFNLWKIFAQNRIPLGFELELTARCNLNCRHCYVNLPANNLQALSHELTTAEILELGKQAVNLGVVWCTLTGGEPLLRPDFSEIYFGLKRLGLLVSVYTNATLINETYARLFREYPPRDIEVTVYGATNNTYERITRRLGSFDRFQNGIDLLLEQRVKVRLKAMALRSNLDEMEEIARFCRKRTKDFYRFDPLLHLRTDGNPQRNAGIKAERLRPTEIAELERADPERFGALTKDCARLVNPQRSKFAYEDCRACSERKYCEHLDRMSRLLVCGAGTANFYIASDGTFRLCASLCAPGMTYNLRKGSLKEAWERFVPKIRSLRTNSENLMRDCRSCPIVNLCFNCPATADLECGNLEAIVPYFCKVAHARYTNLRSTNKAYNANCLELPIDQDQAQR